MYNKLMTLGLMIACAFGAACDYNDVVVFCDEFDTCWAKDPAWQAWARATTDEQITEAENNGTWTASPTIAGDECWKFNAADGHACVVHVGSAMLFGRPAHELPLELPGNACHFQGVWESTAEAYGYCLGILDGVAIQLDVDP